MGKLRHSASGETTLEWVVMAKQQEKHPVLRAEELAALLSSVFGGGGSGVTEVWP